MSKKIIWKSLTTKNIGIFITIVVFCFYILPYIFLRDLAYIHVHDNLDSAFLSYHHLASSGYVFPFNTDVIFENIMNGLPIWCLPSCLFVVLLFYIFGSLAGYIINDVIVHIVSFIGMYLLLKEYFIRGIRSQYIVIALSLCFALVPFKSEYGISVSGQPLLLYAFLNILNKKQNIRDYIVIVFFPFYEYFSFAGIFIVCALSIISVADTIRKKKFNYHFLIWVIIFVILCCMAEYRLIYAGFFARDFVAHRVEMDLTTFRGMDFVSNIYETLHLIIRTQYHTGSFRTYAVILAFTTAIVFVWRKMRPKGILCWLPLAIVTICLISAFYRYWISSIGSGNYFIQLLKTFQVNRIYVLLPFLWFLLFGVSLREISKFKKYNYIIYSLLILHLALVGIENEEYKINLLQLKCKIFATKFEKRMEKWANFKGFFATNLFSEIKKYINSPSENYRVVSIGMHPSIAQYNGFYTLDSYQSIYPLEYKHKFRNIIAKELEKNRALKVYFDDWGSRCYVFAAELKDKCFLNCSKHNTYTIDNLEINTKALKELGGKYIISCVYINNFEKLNLTFEKYFEDESAYWKIYLYKVN